MYGQWTGQVLGQNKLRDSVLKSNIGIELKSYNNKLLKKQNWRSEGPHGKPWQAIETGGLRLSQWCRAYPCPAALFKPQIKL